MFKWKVSRLGSKKDRSKQKLNNETEPKDNGEEIYSKNTNNNNNNRSKDGATSSPSPKKFGLFSSSSSGTKTDNSANNANTMTSSRVGQRLALAPPPTSSSGGGGGLALSTENLLDIPPPLPPLKPEWRNQLRLAEQQEEAIPSDSLYAVHRKDSRKEQRPPMRTPGQSEPHPPGSRGQMGLSESTQSSRGQADLAHWSSHGYLAKEPENTNESGYVLLKRHQTAERQSPGGAGPQRLDLRSNSRAEFGREVPRFQEGGVIKPVPPSPSKYFSVKGFPHLSQLHTPPENSQEKYFSVDSSFLAGNPEVRTKIRQNIPEAFRPKQPTPPEEQFRKPDCPEYIKPPPPPPLAKVGPPPPLPPYQRPPPPKVEASLANSKQISGSVSWLEWTQQLQAYVAWVNSQLRKRPGLRPVKDLRTDLQTGEVLAQLIEIISGEEIVGVQYGPESLQGMRENLERVLQFMASKQIKMHNISSRELLEGNLKSVMRLILALAAHYKPQSVKHHDTPGGLEDNKAAGENQQQSSDNHDTSQESSKAESRAESSFSNGSRPDSSWSSAKPADPASRSDNIPPSRSWADQRAARDKVVRDQDPGENLRRNQQQRRISSPKSSSVETQTGGGVRPSSVLRSASPAGDSNRSSAGPSPVSSRGGGGGGLVREGSFVRSGSGRKLPQIPERVRSNTLPSGARKHEEAEEEEGEAEEGGEDQTSKNKPKALEFWESMENIERNDFRYNTIHRMSVGRRMLPKPPGGGGSHSRSQSMDRGEAGGGELHYREEKMSLNSSFSGPSSLPIHSVPASPHVHHKIPPDGASLQSENSDLEQRREGEGSSDKNSPPTSVVLGQVDPQKSSLALDWLQGMGHNGAAGKKWRLPSPLSFEGAPLSFEGPPLENERNVPYSVLLQELNQAKKQLQELYNLLLTNGYKERDIKGNFTRIFSSDLSQPDFLKTEPLKSLLLKDRHLGSEDRKCHEDFNEELRVAREAISSLRSMFRDHDPGHHILDTLENCVSIIVEKASSLATGSAAHEAEPEAEVAPPPTTKIIYFMPRSATPFMTSIARPVGQVTLRDFKAVFDRPGFYRYHSKNTDTEYGMVKEEIADDDRILPGSAGKIVLWVEEE